VKKFKGKPFVLLGVNRDNDREKLKKIIKRERISWRSWFGPIVPAWHVWNEPTTFVLDAKGVIRFKDLRDKQLEEAVEKLLQETASKP
jgi:peroxiredoxin